jgi:hypothetical protein
VFGNAVSINGTQCRQKKRADVPERQQQPLEKCMNQEPKFYAIDGPSAYPADVGTDDRIEMANGALFVHLNGSRSKLIGLQSLDFLISQLEAIRAETFGAKIASEQSVPVNWVPCSPAWLEGGGDCACAPRLPGNPGSGTSHYHPALAPQVVEPEGWHLVPIQATRVMTEAAELAGTQGGSSNSWLLGKMWQAMLEVAPKWPGAALHSNRYGLDAGYFTRKLMRMVRDIGDFKPAEMARELARMSKTADADVLAEPEFTNPASTKLGGAEAASHE